MCVCASLCASLCAHACVLMCVGLCVFTCVCVVYRVCVVYQVCGLLLGSTPGLGSAPLFLKRRCESLCVGVRPSAVSLYLCHGALAMLNWKSAPPGPQGERLLLLVPDALLDLDVR